MKIFRYEPKRESSVLGVASQVVLQELSHSRMEGRLRDNLPRHIALQADGLDEAVVETIRRAERCTISPMPAGRQDETPMVKVAR